MRAYFSRLRVGILTGLLLGLMLIGYGCGEKQAQQSYQEQVIDAGINVMNSLVFIKSIRETFAEGKKQEYQIFGSGVIISSDGYVLTNNHVTEKSVQLKCTLSGKIEVTAELVGSDKDFDIAIIKLDLTDVDHELQVAVLGDSSALDIGDTVMALGAPLGFERSITQGILSCDNRFLEEIPEVLWLQTDAAINPGNSGGPLINTLGEVVGVNTLGIPSYYGQGIGFSIPINIVKEFKEELIETSKVTRSWTGLRLQALSDFSDSEIVTSTEGVLISGLDPGSPGELAGIRSGDVLVRVGKQQVQGLFQEHIPGLYRFLLRLQRDKELQFEVRRKEETLVFAVTPTEKKKKEGDEIEIQEWNMTVKEINQFSEPRISFYKKTGVYVLGVKDGGNAETSGVSAGDIIMQIEHADIDTLQAFQDAYEMSLQKNIGDRFVMIDVFRDGMPRKLVLDYNMKRKSEDSEVDSYENE